MLHTMKLATARGKRILTKRITIGSSRKAIVIAMNIVMKKDRKLKSTEFERNLYPTLAAMAL